MAKKQTRVGNIENNPRATIVIGDHSSAKVIQTSQESVERIVDVFAIIMKEVDNLPENAVKDDVRKAVREAKAEAQKSEQTYDVFWKDWFHFLVRMAPDIWEVAVNSLANPASGIHSVFNKIAERAKSEREARD